MMQQAECHTQSRLPIQSLFLLLTKPQRKLDEHLRARALRGVQLYNSRYGVLLDNTWNGRVTGDNNSGNETGIGLNTTINTTVSGNTISLNRLGMSIARAGLLQLG